MSLFQSNIKYHITLFLISPVLGLVYGLKSRSYVNIRWSIFGFVVIYGSLFNSSFLGDGAVHWNNVYSHYQNLNFSTFWSELLDIMVLDHSREVNDDPYIHILSYFVGFVLNAPGLFFVFVAAVYGYFYSGVVVKILVHINRQSNYNRFYLVYFIIILILWVFPLKMQTVRTWTAMWILLYAILSFDETKKIKYLILSLTPPLVHIGFLALAIPIWIVLFSGYKKPRIYFILFILSMFFSSALQQTRFSSLATRTSVGASKIEAYTLDENRLLRNTKKYEEKAESTRFYKLYEEKNVQKIVLTGMIIFIYGISRKMGFGKVENMLFSYGLAMATFSNFFTTIYAVHNRGWEIVAVLILSLLVIFLSKNKLESVRNSLFRVKLPLFFSQVGLLPFGFYLFSNVISFTSPFVFFLPLLSWIEPGLATNIRSVISYIL